MTSYAESYDDLVKAALTKREDLKKELREKHDRARAAELEAAAALADAQVRSALEAFGSGSDYWVPSQEFCCRADGPAHDMLFDKVESLTGITRQFNDDGETCFDFSVTLD